MRRSVCSAAPDTRLQKLQRWDAQLSERLLSLAIMGAKLRSFLWNSSDNQSTIVQRSLMEAIGLFLQKDMQISIHVSAYRPEKGGKNYGTAFIYFPRKFSHKLKWYCNTEMVLRFGRLLRIPWVDFASESCIFRNRILLRFSWNNLFQDSFN